MLLHHKMLADAVSLYLLDAQLADWIRGAGDDRRRRFAFACAELTIGQAAALLPDVESRRLTDELAALHQRAAGTRALGFVADIGRTLEAHEQRLQAELTTLQQARTSARPFEYAGFRRVALLFYATRALEAALHHDSITAAGRAAFATIAATQDEARVLGLAGSTGSGSAPTGDDHGPGTTSKRTKRRA
jgi:hypothetical protein